MESGQFTPEMLDALRGDGDDDGESAARLAKLLDEIIQRLVDEGYLNLEAPPQMPAGHQAVTGPGGLAQRRRRATSSSSSPRRGSTSSATRRCAPSSARSASRASAATTRRISPPASRPTRGASRTSSATRMNLDVDGDAAERARAHGIARRRRSISTTRDLMVRQAEYRSSCATVLMLDYVALDDPLRRGPLHAGQEGRARAHASHSHAVPRRHAARGALPRLGRGDPARARSRTRRWGRTTRTPPRDSSSRGGSCWRRRRTCGRSS